MSPHVDDPSQVDEPAADPTEDEDRDAILARRARFVATALLGMTVLPACDPFPRPCLEAQPVVTSSAPPPHPTEPPPMPCLTPVPNPPTSEPAPQPCLKVADPRPKTSASAGEAPDAGPPPPPPQPCLTPRRTPPAPAPCLLVAPPKPSGGSP